MCLLRVCVCVCVFVHVYNVYNRRGSTPVLGETNAFPRDMCSTHKTTRIRKGWALSGLQPGARRNTTKTTEHEGSRQ